jgi:hypothetical protein
MPPRKPRPTYNPPEPSADLDATAAAMVQVRIQQVAGREAAARWWRRWETASLARRRALRHATALGHTHGRGSKPCAYDRAATDPTALAYLAAYDAGRRQVQSA